MRTLVDGPASPLFEAIRIKGNAAWADPPLRGVSKEMADTAARKRMRLLLTSIHRDLHNRMHRMGQYHHHTPTENHHG
jgi:hypothetical protein